MNILEEIVANKLLELREQKILKPVRELEKSPWFERTPVSFKKAVADQKLYGIIAEFKRKSPSGGLLNDFSLPGDVCREYINAGSSAVSVLTDSEYFGGSAKDLSEVRKYENIPILRKEFIVDEYQVLESRAIGADAILLISEVLSKAKLKRLFDLAKSINLEVLIEIHDEKSISFVPFEAELIGVNSRDLKSLRIDIERTSRLLSLLPTGALRVGESGIRSPQDYIMLREAGYDAFLIGEYFMKSADPGQTCGKFIREIRQLIGAGDLTRQATGNE